jgi:hypothetical protein
MAKPGSMAKQGQAAHDQFAPALRVSDDSAEMEARGRMLTEYGDLRRRLASLMAEASEIGAEFQELSNQLRMCPNVVSIDGLMAPNSSKPAFAQSLFETKRLVTLVSEIRSTIERKNEIQERLQDIGILDAYGQFRY